MSAHPVSAHILDPATRVVLSATVVFLVLTAAVFLGPAVLLGAPGAAGSGGSTALDVLAASLGILQVAILLLALPVLVREHAIASARLPRILAACAGILALANAARLALGIRGSGLGTELVQAALFAAPLVLWAAAVGPVLRTVTAWWARPMRWTVVAFPGIFFLAALGRIDYQTQAGNPLPTPVAWILVYGPTVLAVGLALLGWLAFEEGRRPSRRSLVRSATAVLSPGLLLVVLISLSGSVEFVLSATITWGSGYQLFRIPLSPAPLVLSLFLATVAFSAFTVTLIRLRQGGRPVVGVLLALAAVLSGIFASPISVLGSLVALELLWVHVTRPAALP